jgi:LPXTG-motif cell wall-anchored protein
MMDTTIIRVVAGILFVIVLFFLIQRRRKRVE